MFSVEVKPPKGQPQRVDCQIDSCTIGKADDKLGEEVGAAVMLKAGQSVSDDDLRDFVKENVASYKYPRRIWFVATATAPLTPWSDRGPRARIAARAEWPLRGQKAATRGPKPGGAA